MEILELNSHCILAYGSQIKVKDLDKATSKDITFFHSKKYLNSVKKTKAKIKGIVVLLELSFLDGRSKIKNKLISLNKVNT